MRQTLLALGLVAILTSGACGQRRGPRGFGRGAGPSGGENPPLAKTESEKRILATLDEAVKNGDLFANVPAADGRLLRILAESVQAKQVVEFGTSTGLSGLWLCLALEKTGGKLTTFEYDSGRAATARANFKKAGVDRLVTVIEGDAHQTFKRFKDPIDVVFIDADKEGYVDYLNQVLPLVRPGGLILAHNVEMADDYIRAVGANPDLDTVFYTSGGSMSVTLKKR